VDLASTTMEKPWISILKSWVTPPRGSRESVFKNHGGTVKSSRTMHGATVN
jgi:hypothetical protein